MSRSYKKFPCIKDSNPKAKRRANKRVRKIKERIPNGMYYKKYFCSWNISDWCWEYSWEKYFEEALEDYYQWRWRYEDCESVKNDWEYKNPLDYQKEHYRKWVKTYKTK